MTKTVCDFCKKEITGEHHIIEYYPKNKVIRAKKLDCCESCLNVLFELNQPKAAEVEESKENYSCETCKFYEYDPQSGWWICGNKEDSKGLTQSTYCCGNWKKKM